LSIFNPELAWVLAGELVSAVLAGAVESDAGGGAEAAGV
jgi:hypothetical protein